MKWTEKGEEVLTRTTISPPSPLFPHLLYALRDFKGAGIWWYSYIDYSGHKKWAFQQKQFFACEMGVCRVERGSLWWGGAGACDVGRGAASTEQNDSTLLSLSNFMQSKHYSWKISQATTSKQNSISLHVGLPILGSFGWLFILKYLCDKTVCWKHLLHSFKFHLFFFLPLFVGGYQSWRTLSRKVHQHIDCSILNFAHVAQFFWMNHSRGSHS